MADSKAEMAEVEVQVTDTAVEKPEDKFDEARAMETIRKLRETEKQGKKIAQELERYKKAEEERKQAELSETDRLKAELVTAQEKLKEASIGKLQLEVAGKLGLPAALADRLKGETLEELEADAKAIQESLPKQKAAPNTGTTSPGGNAASGESVAEKRQRLFG